MQPSLDPASLFRLVHSFDILAAVVFAVSGSLVASRKNLDVIAFMWFAVITGVGGGTVRDVILGVPVLFGPYNFSFKETVDDLLAADAGKLVHDASELRRAVVELTADRDARRALGLRGQRVIEAGRGATERNYALLEGLTRVRP